jgi:hypothetical protein
MSLPVYITLITAVIAAQTTTSQPFEVSSIDLTAAIIKNIKFEGELSKLSQAEQDAYLKQLDIKAEVGEKIPRSVLAESPQAAEIVLNSRTMEKALMDAVLELEQTRLLPSLNEQERKEIKDSVTSAMNRAHTIVDAHLSDIIPKDVINNRIEKLTTSIINRIDCVTTYAMKQKPDEKILDQIMSEFEERLKDSKERAVKRLERFTKDSNSEDAEKQADLKLREMESIINEVLNPLHSSILTATSPRELLDLNKNPDKILPGYSEVVKKWTESYGKFSSEKFKERTKQHMPKTPEQIKQLTMANYMKLQADHVTDVAVNDLLNVDILSQSDAATNLKTISQTAVKPLDVSGGDIAASNDTVETANIETDKNSISSLAVVHHFAAMGIVFVTVMIVVIVAVSCWRSRGEPTQNN